MTVSRNWHIIQRCAKTLLATMTPALLAGLMSLGEPPYCAPCPSGAMAPHQGSKVEEPCHLRVQIISLAWVESKFIVSHLGS